MTTQRLRRFWKQAAVVDTDGACGIALDGRPVKAPSKRDLRLRTRPLAEAVAAEWDAQGDYLLPHTMPLTQLANTAFDRVAVHREQIVAEMLRHVDSDLLCYFADSPESLVARQRATFEPLLAWAHERFGVAWATGSGIMPFTQDAAVHDALIRAMAALDDERLTALQVTAPLCASVLLAFALVEGRVSAAQAFEAAFLEEAHQAEAWGEDAEAAERRARLKRDLEDVETFVGLLQ